LPVAFDDELFREGATRGLETDLAFDRKDAFRNCPNHAGCRERRVPTRLWHIVVHARFGVYFCGAGVGPGFGGEVRVM